ncbi:MAG: hypothetical protein ACHQ50_12810, partial [Fimbriimonadales bacterium]
RALRPQHTTARKAARRPAETNPRKKRKGEKRGSDHQGKDAKPAKQVHDVELKSLDVTHLNIVDLDDDRAAYDLEGIVEFAAEVSYDDPDQSYYDHEEGRMIVVGQIDKHVFDTAELSARLVIALDREEPTRSTIQALNLSDGEVFVSVALERTPWMR